MFVITGPPRQPLHRPRMPIDGDLTIHLLTGFQGIDRQTALVEVIHVTKDEFEGYGWRCMQAALRHRGWIVNHRKIKRLMREYAQHPPRRRRFVATTNRGHDQTVFPDRSASAHPIDDTSACSNTVRVASGG